MKVIVINGEGGAGKDTFVKYYQAICPNVHNTSIIDAVKTVAKSCGWDNDKDESGRRFLSDLKDAWARYNDGPYDIIVWRIMTINQLHRLRKGSEDLTIFIHARELEDIKRFVEDFNAFTILIRRPATDGNYHNHADANVNEWKYDLVYENTGSFEQMERDVWEIANYINSLDFEAKIKED